MSRFSTFRLVLFLALSACTRLSAGELERVVIPLLRTGYDCHKDHSREVVPRRSDITWSKEGTSVKPRAVCCVYVIERAERDRLLIEDESSHPESGWVAVQDLIPLNQADSVLTAAIQANPRDVFAYVIRAMVRDHFDQSALALTDLDEALRVDPDNREALVNRAALRIKRVKHEALIEVTPIELERKKLDPALADIDRAIQLNPSDADLFLTRGAVRGARHEYSEALDDLKKAEKLGSPNRDVLSAGVMILVEGHQYGMAREIVTRALKSRPDLVSRYDSYIELALIDLAQWRVLSAVSDLRHAIEVDPKQDSAYLARALICSGLGFPRMGLADLNAAIRLHPENAPSYRFRGQIRYHLGDYEAARADFDAAVRLDPSDADTQECRALLLSTCPDARIRQGREAVASAKRAGDLSGWDRAHCWATLAAAYSETGDYRSAEKCQRKALGMLPKYDWNEDKYRKVLDRYVANKPYHHLGVFEEWGMFPAEHSSN